MPNIAAKKKPCNYSDSNDLRSVLARIVGIGLQTFFAVHKQVINI
jgi:hypothetical protein